MRMGKVHGALLLLGSSGCLQGQSADAVSSFTAKTRLVTVDVSVTDKSGSPVHGLTCADFLLQESKVGQTLQRCEEHRFGVTDAGAAAMPTQPNVFSNSRALVLPETIDVVLVDYLNSGERAKLNDVALNLTRTAPPGHRLAVFALAGKLRLISGYTDDLRSLETKVGKATLPTQTSALGSLADDLDPVTVIDPVLSMASTALPGVNELKRDAQNLTDQSVVQITLDALEQIDRYVGPLPARKNLLWVTSGFPIAFSDVAPPPGSGNHPEDRERTDRLAAMFARDRIAVFPIDVRGVTNPYVTSAAETGAGVQYDVTKFKDASDTRQSADQASRGRMDNLGDRTGGHAYYGNNDTNGLVRRALAAGSEYYALSYRPSDDKDDERIRPFHIEVARPGMHLIYRSSYRAVPTAAPVGFESKKTTEKTAANGSQQREKAARAMSRGLPDHTGVLFAVQVKRASEKVDPFTRTRGQRGGIGSPDQPTARYELNYQLNPDDLEWTVTKEGRTAELIALIAVYDKHNDLRAREDRKVTLKLSSQQYAALGSKALPMHQSLLLPEKETFVLRLGVQDSGSARIGTVEVPTAMLRQAATASASGGGVARRPR